ncbi:WavE lipopolysaccharide synthesis family protein [Komagataeibacter saccharivorans]|uniref:WavE lipopolysaccharide synthesis family protein n=1 Tax=Komagataeibacter saccharivorans TaxID=265959 RepID=UPI000C82CFCA|nr:WavE lipopolysaccharide synthesis family protein [Komagataeibacter saccharivorans]
MKIENKSISIVIHGGCFEKNASELANILINYRKEFKESEIIFSISSSDFIDFNNSNEFSISSYKKNMTSFCYVVNKCADKIAYSHMAQSLPPVYRDGPNTHPNHMIESARNGLALASREFVLRTRNDLLFKDRSFIDKYIDLSKNYYKKGKYTVFSAPVMIASIYTLNPFAESRLPFHYSDWFNFGKLVDIRPIWDVPFITLDFATYYLNHYYKVGSMEKERNFFFRTAVEQYIYFNFFSSHFKNLRLDFHNDDRSINESIEILRDNFVVSDIYNLNVYYPKYLNGFEPCSDNNKRIKEDEWKYLSSNRGIKPSVILSFTRETMNYYTPKIFPFKIEAQQLLTKNGFHFLKHIVVPVDAPPGVACFGPHLTLEKGYYRASVAISALYPQESICIIRVSATGRTGGITLNQKDYTFNKTKEHMNKYIYLDVEFENPHDLLEGFEIVVRNDAPVDLAIDYINLVRMD